MPNPSRLLAAVLLAAAGSIVVADTSAASPSTDVAASPLRVFESGHARIRIDDQGFIVSLTDRRSGKEYAPVGHPSPILSLHEEGMPSDTLLAPVNAAFRPEKKEVEFKYPNGAVAVVKAEAKDAYFRFQLVSLAPRGKVDAVVWGPLNTTISGKMGDLLGVVRSEDFAIGLYGLDDNTISGPLVDSDCYSMGYVIHSPDPVKCPLPPNLKEGQAFAIGGDGVSDTAFFSHMEEYYQYICGTGAKVEPAFGSSVAYNARDRRKSHVHCWTLLGAVSQRFRARHMVSDPIPGVDFIGSAVALYACPDDQGLATLEKITKAEGLPYITDRDGVWIRDPAAYRATIHWIGPIDKAIEYTKAMGLKDISRNTGEYYPSLRGEFIEGKGYEQVWPGMKLGFADGHALSYKEFGELCRKEGLTHGGLHAMSTFLQGGCAQLNPPSEHLQTVCRTTLAKDISAADTEIVVTDPSFLAEQGNWATGEKGKFLRIGTEMLTYEGISEGAPWTLKGIKRGHYSKAAAHKAGDELVKLQQNVYNGYLPDMTLMLDFADYYASLMVRNGMDSIDFDGFEAHVGTNHGYYAVRQFCRRFFDTYHKLSGGKWPRMTTSNVFAGSWEYLNVCNIGGAHLFNPSTGQRGIQGKDLCNGWGNSWFPGTFGHQPWRREWSLYDAENLEAKAVGWDATYALEVTAANIDATGERDAIFKAFHAWNAARAAKAFTKEQKLKLRDPDFKFHLEQTGPQSFLLHPIKELFFRDKNADIANPNEAQPLQMDLRLRDPAEGCSIALPDGGQIKFDQKIERGQFIVCKGDTAYLADPFRKKIADVKMDRPATLPAGKSGIGVKFPGKGARFDLTVWMAGKAENAGK